MSRYSPETVVFSGPLISADDALRVLSKATVLDCRAGPGARDQWLLGHAPGARFVDLERDLSEVRDPKDGGRHPLPEWTVWLERVGSWGIEPSTPVLLYDASNSGMAAARAWWMFRAIGHQPLAVIDGGWDALRRAGVSAEAGDVLVEGRGTYRTELSRWNTVGASQVESMRADAGWTLIDARAPERYQGLVEPIDPVAGHIPGAVNLYWQRSLHEDGSFLPNEVLREQLASTIGDTPPERLVCYCGSGVTACHVLLAMEAAGMRGAQLYVGSWSEWCRTRSDAISPP